MRNSPDARSILLSRNHNQRLGLCLAPTDTLLPTAHIRLVHLDPPRELIPPWSYHRASQFMHPRPGCLIALQAQHPLEPQGASAVLLAGDPPDRPEPKRQRLAGILENCPSRHRTLVVATGALQPNSVQWPCLSTPTTRATEALWPTQAKQILPAGRFRREARLKLQQISREILHVRPYYLLWSPESSKYPSSNILAST